MAEFVVYHNPDRMGYTADAVDGFNILTNKNVPSVLGSRVWLLTGEGAPRTYYLRGHFTATRRSRSDEAGFAWLVEGSRTSGFKLPRRRWVILNDEPWFRDFRRSQGNFALGLQSITDRRYIKGLEKALRTGRLYER